MIQLPAFTAKQICKFIDGTIEGDANATVECFGQIDQCPEKGLTFLTDQKYAKCLYDTKASIAIVSQEFVPDEPVTCTLIRVKNPKKTFITLLQLYDDLKPKRLGISKQAIVNKSAVIGQGVYIGDGAVVEEEVVIGDDAKIYPQVYLGSNVSVGENTIIYAGAKIYEGCRIGNNCIIHSGAVIGADGFGFVPDEKGNLVHIPQMGTVILEDEVEIGANTCVDRAMLESTIIHKGTKIDNLVQIAHNCQIGEHTVMAAGCGVAGSATIGNHCVLGGQVGVKDHVKIGNYVQVAAQSGVHRNVKDKTRLIGTPAIDATRGIKAYGTLQMLPDFMDRLNRLEQLQEDKEKEK
ncbi:MAG: UDP-3-O-(3-hydroxymyristoyl)glucosamine N-acyltransferase [Bacteroidales bacterium]|nr:UDP-3-O-(3-hydroxymyristoyl)glucosamine N-acyltransferase [Bacteroidales bacterium]